MALLTLVEVLATEAMRGEGLDTDAMRGEGLALAVAGRGEGVALGEGEARTEPLEPDVDSLEPVGIVLALLGVFGEILLPEALPDLCISLEPDLERLPLLAER